MTVRDLIDAINREAERALVGYPLDMDAEIEVRGTTMVHGRLGLDEINVTGKATRLERIGARVILHF